MKKIILSVIIFLQPSILINSQVNQEWIAIYNGPGNNGDEVSSMTIDDSCNIYVTGSSVGIGTSYDYATIKYNTNGIQQWVSRYNGTGNNSDWASAMTIDHAGNVYVTGRSRGIEGNDDFATEKYNSFGIQQWIARYNGPANGDDASTAIAVDNQGNIYVTGFSFGNGTDFDYLTIKYNSLGIQQWIARFNSSGSSDKASSIAVDNSYNVYVTGSCFNSGTAFDYATIKYNSFGSQEWVKFYNASNNDFAFVLGLDSSNNVYVTGRENITTLKYNSQGILQWVKINSGYPHSMVVDPSGNVYLCGDIFVNNTDYATLKYNTNGIQQWAVNYNGTSNGEDYANNLTFDNLRNVYVTGTSHGLGYAFATIKYNSSGELQWVQKYQQGVTYEGGISVKVDRFYNVYVTGYTGANDYSNYVTIKYSQAIGIQPVSSTEPSYYSLYQNYPNPFNPSTNIEINIKSKSYVQLIIYNILGVEIEKLINKELNPGTYKILWNASKYSSGIYYYKLIADNFTETRKMVYIK